MVALDFVPSDDGEVNLVVPPNAVVTDTLVGIAGRDIVDDARSPSAAHWSRSAWWWSWMAWKQVEFTHSGDTHHDDDRYDGEPMGMTAGTSGRPV